MDSNVKSGRVTILDVAAAAGVSKSTVSRILDERLPSSDNDTARKALLLEKQPSGEFVTPDELGALAVFFCSPAANQVRGVAWNMDGGWAAQ